MATISCVQTPVEQVTEGDVIIDMAQRSVVIEKIVPEGGDYLIDGLDERTQQGTFYVVHSGTTLRVRVAS